MKGFFIFVLAALSVASQSWAQNSVTGSLPYSNQWEYEKADSLLFAVWDPQTLSSVQFDRGDFGASVPTAQINLYGLNYWVRLGDALVTSSRKSLSVWLKSSLELGAPSTGVASNDTPLSDASNSGQLFVGRAGIGPMLSWDLNSFLRPFVASELWVYAYRHSASINAIDFGGQGFVLEPEVGVESRVLDPVHVVAQIGFNRALSRGGSAIIASSTSFSLGMGVLF